MHKDIKPERLTLSSILSESHRRMADLATFNNDTAMKMDKFCLSIKHEIHEYYEEIRSIDEYLMELPKKDSPSPKEVDYFKQMCGFLLRKFHRSQFPMVKIKRTLDILNGYAKTIHYENHRLYTDYFRLIQSYRQLLDDIEMFEDDNDVQIIDREQYRYAQYDEKLDMYDIEDLSDEDYLEY